MALNDSAVFGMGIITQELNLLQKECEGLVEHHAAEASVVKTRIDELLRRVERIGKTSDKRVVGDVIRDYSKIILDLTHLKENQLVDEEFPPKDGYDRMQRILESLSQPQNVIYQVFCPNTYAQHCLGKEMAECLHWRRGALCYMYCHTVMGNRDRMEQNKMQILKCLKNGVKELQAMLTMRNPISPEDGEMVTNSQDALSLLRQGIFSDTHVLALMYAGEMCFWHKMIKDSINKSNATSNQSNDNNRGQRSTTQEGSTTPNTNQSDQSNSTQRDSTGQRLTQDGAVTDVKSNEAMSVPGNSVFDAQKLGLNFLQQYVNVVKGPLRSAGWDYIKAEDMIKKL